MKIILSTLKKILFWSYERGSWQYDVMCVLILAFIFLSPNTIFHSSTSTPVIARGAEIGQIDPNDVVVIEDRPRQKDANASSIWRIEKAEDSSGKISHVAWRNTFDEAVQFTEKQHETK